MQKGWSGLRPKLGDGVELRIVDAPLARALFHGSPAARLLARARLAHDEREDGEGWDARLARLLGGRTATFDRVRATVARHARVAFDEGPLPATDATIAVLVWATATEKARGDRSPRSRWDPARPCPATRRCSPPAPRTTTASQRAEADKRAPAFEACLRMATRSSVGPMPWEQLQAIAAQLERAPLGVQLSREGAQSIFPRRADDEIADRDRRVAPVDRAQLDELVSRDPRELASAVWQSDNMPGGDAGSQLATFLADLTRLLAEPGSLVAVVVPLQSGQSPDFEQPGETGGAPSWIPASWSSSGAAAIADALERGATTLPRVRTEVARGGAGALDAISAEMLHVGAHPFASAGFAEILARSGRPGTSFAW